MADFAAIGHAALLLMLLAGAVAVLCGRFTRWPLSYWQRAYLALVFLTSLTILCFDRCPLTSLEWHLRALGDPAMRIDSFFIAYHMPFVHPAGDALGLLLLMVIGCAGMGQGFLVGNAANEPQVEPAARNTGKI